MNLKNAYSLGLSALLTLAVYPVFGQTATPPAGLSPNVSDVIKLAQSGAGDDVVVAFIKGCQSPYHLSADDIVYLKNEGLSSTVLTSMLNHDNALRGQAPPPYTYEQHLYAPSVQSTPAPAPALAPVPAQPAVPEAATVPNASSVASAPSVTTPASQPQPTNTTVVEQAPPPPQVEVVPVSPGPAYYWIPGYWGWNGGVWIWVGGHWGYRPYVGAVWVAGGWHPHGHGYIWVGGHWH